MSRILSRDSAFGVPDPALASLYKVFVPFLGSTTILVAETISPTYQKIPAVARFGHGSNTYFPDVNDIDGLTITFYETHDFLVTKWLKAWRKMVVNPEDSSYGVPTTYKQEISVHYYNGWSPAPVYLARYIGCWPTDQGTFSLDYSNLEGKLSVEAQFSVDSMSDT